MAVARHAPLGISDAYLRPFDLRARGTAVDLLRPTRRTPPAGTHGISRSARAKKRILSLNANTLGIRGEVPPVHGDSRPTDRECTPSCRYDQRDVISSLCSRFEIRSSRSWSW
jgi:hypothetical protein